MIERSACPAQRGFALILALWAVVIILALAAALDAWVVARVEQARLIRERVQDGVDAYSTRATVLYLLGTQRFTRAGLTTEPEDPAVSDVSVGELRIDPVGGEIALDGTPYHGLGRIRFALQDQSGMIALNSEAQDRLGELLASSGNDDTATQQLLDTLADYRDGNTLRRLNGAESEEYEAAGLPPPANTHLRSAPELLRVLGWPEWLREHPEFRLHEWLSASRIATFNPNLVPASLLARLPGMNAKDAERILAERQREPFRSVPDFSARSSYEIPLDEEQFRFFPADTLQLRIWRDGAPQAEVLALQLTPLGQQGPWQAASIYRINRAQQDEANEVPGQLFSTHAAAAR